MMVTGPLVAFDGTDAVMLVSLHDVAVAATPLNCTWLLDWLPPNPEPVIVMKLTG